MAEYKQIHGTTVRNYTADPSNPVVGQVWYNSTSATLKGFTSNPAGSWASGGSINTARGIGAGSGTKTATLIFGGTVVSPGAAQTKTESYDGSSWTEVADLNTARDSLGGTGTQSSSIGTGGNDPSQSAKTETWDGTSWTEVADLNTARNSGGSSGNQTAALFFGGPSSQPYLTSTESWDGTSWTEVGNLSTGRYGLQSSSGTGNTSALGAGGYNIPYVTATEEFTSPLTSTVTFSTD